MTSRDGFPRYVANKVFALLAIIFGLVGYGILLQWYGWHLALAVFLIHFCILLEV